MAAVESPILEQSTPTTSMSDASMSGCSGAPTLHVSPAAHQNTPESTDTSQGSPPWCPATSSAHLGVTPASPTAGSGAHTHGGVAAIVAKADVSAGHLVSMQQSSASSPSARASSAPLNGPGNLKPGRQLSLDRGPYSPSTYRSTARGFLSQHCVRQESVSKHCTA